MHEMSAKLMFLDVQIDSFFACPFIFMPLIFAHPLKMNFRAPVNFRAHHKFKGTFEVFLMKNIDEKGKKETK